jgi:hypothetical protein
MRGIECPMVVDSVPGTRYADFPALLSFLVAQTRRKVEKGEK